MANIFTATFSTDLDSFDAGTRVASPGANFQTGYMSIGVGVTATRTFTAVTSGTIRARWRARLTNTNTGSANGTVFFLYPTGASAGSANSAAVVFLSGQSTDGATSTLARVSYRNSSGIQAGPLVTRNAWHDIEVRLNVTARTYSVWVDGVSVVVDATSPNGSYTDVNRFVAAGQASYAGDVDEITVESTYSAPSLTTNAYDQSNYYYSPGNWYAGASWQESNNAGAYLRTQVTTGADGVICADWDTTHHSSIDNDSAQVIEWYIDRGTASERRGQVPLRYSSSTVRTTLEEGLSSGSHTVEIRFARRGTTATTTNTIDRWNTVTSSIRFKGLAVSGSPSFSAPATFSKTAIWYGDSISEGVAALSSGTLAGNYPFTCVPFTVVHEDIGFELGSVGFSGMGWVRGMSNSTTAPNIVDGWDFHKDGTARDISGFNLICINLGVNDANYSLSTSQVTANVEATLTAMRAANASAILVVIVPYAGDYKSHIEAGFDNYQTATPDTKCHLIDLGTDVSSVIENGTNSLDGIHPNETGHALIRSHLTPVLADLVPQVAPPVPGSALLDDLTVLCLNLL